ncbi:YobA family protein [Peribacillus frigoritolerans]|uniref:YobA family protein n=1 Tax=Peribacillus frigoritolerans TaxID=450367 RepID=UPI00222606E0|nr:YobA family protein [Peribacillus frigoritolerans]UYY97210.1 YobA family protein [Peribacillus frigoritolerans]
MKMIVNLYIYLFVAFILGSCQFPGLNMDESIDKGEEGFITDLDDKRILIKGTYYKVTNDTYIQDQHGNDLDYAELEIGMKVKPWHRGGVKKSFPGKAEAELILVLTDENSLAEQRAVIAALDHVSKAESQRFMVLEVVHLPSEHVYNIEMMNRSNLDSSFTVTVEDVTDEILYIK